MRIKYQVTSEDIAHGEAEDTETCAIALSLTRTLGPGFAPSVYTDKVTVGIAGFRRDVSLSRAAQRFVARFDANKPVKPQDFIIEIPDNIVEEIRESQA